MFRDFFGAPPGTANCDVQEFTAGNDAWQTWQKPRGCSMVYMIAVGSGSGGAGGMTGAIATVRGGGGAGGGAAVSKLLIPDLFVEDTLFIQVAVGGAGGAATVNGTAGGLTYVSRARSTTAVDVYARSGNAAAGVAGAGSVGGGGAGGSAGTAANALSSVPAGYGIQSLTAGGAGSAGGAVGGAAGVAVTATLLPYQGGAGGGTTPAANTEFAGGAFTPGASFPAVVGGAAGGNPGNASGGYGFRRLMPYPGAGGGTGGAAATVGGNGAPGGIGCGGGGGGGGVTGGRGGRGGDGYVLIVAW